MTPSIRPNRCAVYTRKSTEEGLEMEFNSLDAQRDACESYIASQKHEGWILLADAYDDGGFTGGNMDRPALRRLMTDIKNGKIDTVVVYKVDRLSRSLADFAKLIEVFDTNNVSFVSVTQQFNTTNSMGRLTLNILLSFAQFEREVIGERIRDKFSASKRKGIWMGGVTPMGYRVQDRQLHIHPDEARSVKAIFEGFLRLGSISLLIRELPALGIVSRKREAKNGRVFGGTTLDKGAIYKILHNPIYLGKIRHKDKVYEGRHEPIVSQRLWDDVHAALKESPRTKATLPKHRSKAVLCGVLRCGGCNSAMTPCHTRKKTGKLYRYYAAVNYKKGGCPDCPIKQVTASEIETVVLHQLQSVFAAPEMILDVWQEVGKRDGSVTESEVRQALIDIFPVWNQLFPREQERLLNLMLEKVVIHPGHVDVRVRVDGLESLVRELDNRNKQVEAAHAGGCL
jgi:site-specific DNA recombinase